MRKRILVAKDVVLYPVVQCIWSTSERNLDCLTSSSHHLILHDRSWEKSVVLEKPADTSFFLFSLTQLSSGKHRARTPVPWNTMYLGDQQLLLKSLKLKILYLEPTAVESLRSSPIQRNLPMYWTSRGVYSARYRCSSLTSMRCWRR